MRNFIQFNEVSLNGVNLGNNPINNSKSEVRIGSIVNILKDIKLFFHQQSNLNSLIAYNIGYIIDVILKK